MTIETTKIPRRQKCVDKAHPYTSGAVDIIDDDLQLTQAQINAIVLGGAITLSLTTNKPTGVFVGTETTIKVTATINTHADSIKIFKNGVAEAIATGSDTSLVYDDRVTPSDRGTIQYYAEFTVGGLVKRQPVSGFVSVPVVDPVYTGAGTTYEGTTMAEESSPHTAGSFNKTITTADGDFLFIEVPDNFNLTGLNLVGQIKTPLAFTQIASRRTGYKAYKNDEPRGVGSYKYEITIANA